MADGEPLHVQRRMGGSREAVEHLPITQGGDSDIEGSNGTSAGPCWLSAGPDSSPCQRFRYGWGIGTPQVPAYLRSDNGVEFTAKAVRDWLGRVGVKTLHIEPGSPWENGHIESFNGKLRDELLNVEVFDTVLEAKVLIER